MDEIYDVAIIGGGPAGMTAGIYVARQGLKAILIAEGFGGQMAKKTVEVENYPGFIKISGLDLIKKFEEHLRSQNVEIKLEKIINLSKNDNEFVIKTDNSELKAKTAIIASGAEPRMLNVKGEKEFIGKGISYCPTCDGPMFKNKDVAVIGGGNAGCETAIFLSGYVNKIYILERGKELLADATLINILKEKGNIQIMTDVVTQEIKGTRFVEELGYVKKEEVKSLKVSGVFVEIGYQPATSFISPTLVDLNERGEIVRTDKDTGATKTPGLFVAGDVCGGKCKQIVVAAADGAKAATAASKYLHKYD